MELFTALAVIGGMGLVFGGLLAFAASHFAVEEDARVETICDLLPGANCGACGFPGCISFAENVILGKADVSACIPGGKDTCDSVCEVLGVDSVAAETKNVAEIYCLGSRDVAPDKFEYQGVRDCKAALAYSGGFKACSYGCLGLGTCADSCPFDALHMGADGLPVVDLERCTGCAICVKACPRGIIRIVDADRAGKFVPCNSKDKGKIVREVCEIGCIGDKACVKACPQDAIVVEDNLAVIDSSKCDDCGKCVEVCRRRIIKDVKRVHHG